MVNAYFRTSQYRRFARVNCLCSTDVSGMKFELELLGCSFLTVIWPFKHSNCQCYSSKTTVIYQTSYNHRDINSVDGCKT